MKMRHMIGLLPVIGFFLGGAAFAAHPPVALPESGRIQDIPSSVCGDCHQAIYRQWSGSMHANSTALKDPIHGAVYRSLMGDPQTEGVRKRGAYPVCLNCHAPAAALDGKTKLDARPAYNGGVNCVSCHAMERYLGIEKPGGGLQLGVRAYRFSDTELQGPNGDRVTVSAGPDGAEARHIVPIRGNPELMKTKAACMGCHDQRPNAHGVSMCATGDEIRAVEGPDTCQSCHMPIVDGVASHAMLGGHNPAMVEHGLAMTVSAARQGGDLRAEVHLLNKTPHNFPTGAPFRNVYINVAALDENGKTLWQNAPGHPMKADPQAMLFYALGDEAGKPAPPPKAKQVLADSRLKPNERRTLRYAIPATGVVRVEARAYYNLLLPPMVKQLRGKIPEDLTRPMLVGTAQHSVGN